MIGGFGGLAAGLAWMEMADTLNRNRAPDDQIPVVNMSLRDIERSMEPRFRQWRIVREFHRANPESRLYAWYVGGTAWLVFFGILTFAFFFHYIWYRA